MPKGKKKQPEKIKQSPESNSDYVTGMYFNYQIGHLK